ncbi:hypothetical protein ACVWZ6_003338 [Bradyrhizobium sp. GM6.1]
MPHATPLVLAAIVASSALLVLAPGGAAKCWVGGCGHGDKREQRQRWSVGACRNGDECG